MNKLSRVELQKRDGIIPDLHRNKQNEDCHTWNVRTKMYVCTGKEYTGMYDQINKVHAPTETEQSLTTVKLTKPWTSNGIMCCEEKANKAWEN